MTPTGQYPKPTLRPEEVIEGMLVRCPALEWSSVTRGTIYVVLWKVFKPKYAEKYPMAAWQIGLQRYNRPPLMWPKPVGIGHIEHAFGAVFMAGAEKKASAPSNPQLVLPF